MTSARECAAVQLARATLLVVARAGAIAAVLKKEVTHLLMVLAEFKANLRFLTEIRIQFKAPRQLISMSASCREYMSSFEKHSFDSAQNTARQKR